MLLFDERDVVVYLNEEGEPEDAQEAQKARDKLSAAKRTIRDLGSQLIAFAESEPVAAMALKILGYRARQAGEYLIGLSEHLAAWGPEEQRYKISAEAALGFKRAPRGVAH